MVKSGPLKQTFRVNTMKKQNIFVTTLVGLAASLAMTSTHAMMPGSGVASEAGKRVIDRDGEYAKTPTINLCVDYYKEKSVDKKKAYLKELDLRAQLSEKDHDLVKEHKVVPGMTMCGMYMSVGTPQAQKTRQLRPMVFKTVHVYDNMYCVTQSGMVVQTYERKEGSLPPKLAAEKPEVAPSPTLQF